MKTFYSYIFSVVFGLLACGTLHAQDLVFYSVVNYGAGTTTIDVFVNNTSGSDCGLTGYQLTYLYDPNLVTFISNTPNPAISPFRPGIY